MNRNYFCSDCNLATHNPRLYLEHRRSNHGETISIYECDLCIYATKHSTKLLRHRRTVHRGIPANFSGRSTNSVQQSTVISHQNIDTDQVRVLNCTLCEFCSINKVLLIDHFRTAHPTAPIYECDQCCYSHFIKEKFARHQRYHSVHRVRCHICEFKTIYRWNLDRHLRHHTDEAVNEFRCQTCNFNATTKQSISSHEKNHHGHGQFVTEMSPVNAALPISATSPMEQLSFVGNSYSNENENTAINDDNNNEQSADVNDFDPMHFVKLVWEGIWNAAKENGNDLSQNVIPPIASLSRSPTPTPAIFEYYFQCRKCSFRNEINFSDLSKNQNHSTSETNTNNNDNNDSLNENINNGRSYRCGYCHQSSSWKHVIERHCRLVHKSESFVERFSAYEHGYHRLMPSVRRLKERLSTQMQVEHEQ